MTVMDEMEQPYGENTTYDVAVVGTGMVETMVAAALSRVGYKVVQIDNETSYGNDYSNHTFITLQDHLRTQRLQSRANSSALQEQRVNRLPFGNHSTLIDIEKVGPVLSFQNEADVAPGRRLPFRYRTGSGSNSTYALSSLATESNITLSPSSTAPNSRRASIIINDNAGGPPRRTVSANSISRASLPPVFGKKTSSPRSAQTPTRTYSPLMSPDLNDINRWLALLSGRSARQFSIDLMPKLVWTQDEFTSKMRDTVSRYLCFTGFSRLVLYSGGRIRPVPYNREEIFADKHLTPKEKNILYKFVKVCVSYADDPRTGVKFLEQQRAHNPDVHIDTFGQLLYSFQLPVHVIESIKHTIAMCSTDVPAMEGMERIGRFMARAKVFPNCRLPFLWPHHGIGELPQAFARMAAVFGAVQILDTAVEALELSHDSNTTVPASSSSLELDMENLSLKSSNDDVFAQSPAYCKALLTKENKRIRARQFVINARFLPESMLRMASASVKLKVISHVTVIAESSVLIDGVLDNMLSPLAGGDADSSERKQQVLFGRWRTRGGLIVSLLELPPYSVCCPEGSTLLYLWCDQQQPGASARSLLEPLINHLYYSKLSRPSSARLSVGGSVSSSVATSTTSINTGSSGSGLNRQSTLLDESVEEDEETSCSNKARLIWAVYYNHLCWEVDNDQLTQVCSSDTLQSSMLPANVHVTSNARSSPDFDGEFNEAKRVFERLTRSLPSNAPASSEPTTKTESDDIRQKLFDGCDVFLQKVPDPEDVILE